ncbi:MAG TPA: PrsW family glutamic-type intramembrane protease [Anaeromyxobacteraceae bacterium]|nr:PrsW family glutamic-type intramembrane protease [Anaeromyxobacteraceae bacterium]
MGTFGHGVGVGGPSWLAVCAGLGFVWVLVATSRAEGDHLATALRGILGGLAALGVASIGYGLLQLAGLQLRWSWIAAGSWPALGAAGVVGLVEEGAKLFGVALAVPPSRKGERTLFGTTLTVASVFAVAEAAVALQGAGWPVAVTRVAFGPVAHGLLAAPFAVALAEVAGLSRGRAALRVALAVALAALLHGFADFCVAQAGWGQAGFATALLAPALWLYARDRLPVPFRWVAGISGRNP